MMHGILRMVAVLLVVTVTTALPGAHALPFPADRVPANPGQHPAGCHNHGPATPSPSPSPSRSPAPASYECCVSGHEAAIPNATFSTRPLLALVSALESGEEFPLISVRLVGPRVSVVPSNSPPGAAPLRI